MTNASNNIKVSINKNNGQMTIKINKNYLRNVLKSEENFINFCCEFENVTGIPLMLDSKIDFIKRFIDNINSGGK